MYKKSGFSLHIVLIFATLAQLPTYNNKLTKTGLFLLFYNLSNYAIMAKNKDGIYRSQHNEKLQHTAEYYCEMCELADFPKSELVSLLFKMLKISAIEEKVKVINPNRFKDSKRISAHEVRLYNLFLSYCLLDLLQDIDADGEIPEYSQIADYCTAIITAESGNEFGDLNALSEFDAFICCEFFPPYDAKIHDKIKGAAKFGTGWGKPERVALKNPLFCCPTLVNSSSPPYVLQPRNYSKYKKQK